MQVRFKEGPRKGQVVRMAYHHAAPLINQGYVEPVYGMAANNPGEEIPEPEDAVVAAMGREPEVAMVEPQAERMVKTKPTPRKK